MQIFQMETGLLPTNTYLLCQGESALVIDPDGAEIVWQECERKKVRLSAVILTHGHFDHFGGVAGLVERQEREYGQKLPVYGSELDAPSFVDPVLNYSAEYRQYTPPVTLDKLDGFLPEGHHELFGFSFDVLELPGHSPGCIALKFGDDLFVGDVLMHGGVGRIDERMSGARAIMRASLTRLFALPDGVRVYPGHGPTTTIGGEREGIWRII